MDELLKVTRDIKILYLESDEKISEETSKTLALFFTTIFTVSNGQDALKLFNKHNDFDIILTDINMITNNNTDFIDYIKNLYKDFPITILTTNVNGKNLLQFINHGINGYLVKPVDNKILIDTISTAVEPRILKKELEQINDILINDLETSNLAFNSIFNDQNNLMAIVSRNKIFSLNKSFLNFLGISSITELQNKNNCIVDLFIQEDGYTFISDENQFENIISKVEENQDDFCIKIKSRTQSEEIFQLDIKNYALEDGKYIFTFTNTTNNTNLSVDLLFKIDHDELSGLYNKSYIDKSIQNEINRALRYGNKFCISLINIDFLDETRKTYGSDIADKILINIAKTTLQFLRETDIVAKYSKNKLVILMTETTDNQAYNKLEKLRILIKNKQFLENVNIPISISGGISSFVLDDGVSDMYEKANESLNLAIRLGNNKIVTL